MKITETLPIDCTRAGIPVRSRKHALEIAAELLAKKEFSLTERYIFDAFLERERLGTTNLGNGVAIPHCRLDCSVIRSSFLIFSDSISYDDSEQGNVYMLFALIVPNSENDLHLELIAKLSAIFSIAENRELLKSSTTDRELNITMTRLLDSVRK